MSKTLILATALIAMGMNAAFAGDGDVNAQPAEAAIVANPYRVSVRHTATNAARQESSVWVYGQFGSPGTAQGGQN